MNVSALFVLQVINIVIAIIFLLLFAYRLYYLSHFSQTDKYLNYYPKIRILFGVAYITLSIALFVYNIVVQQFSNVDQQYFFAGGGGELINSVILILQLTVLRQQLKKQRPYTPMHLIYCFYLLVISIVRFGLTLAALISHERQQVVDLVLASCLMGDTCFQLGYWVAKKQSMPFFQANKSFSFDEFRIQSHRLLLNRNQIQTKITQRSLAQDFPYIKSSIKIQQSKFKITLQILVSNLILPFHLQQTRLIKQQMEPTIPNKKSQKKNLSQIIRQSMNMRISKQQSHLEIISEHLYNLEQVKELYLLCGRFITVDKLIVFAELTQRDVAQQLQLLLDQLFDHKENYQSFILRFLRVDKQIVKIYEDKNKHLNQDLMVEKINSQARISPPDFNAIFMSVQIYRQLWIQDHYVFYMKVGLKQTSQVCYPMRRYSQFQDLDLTMRSLLSSRLANNQSYQLPQLSKKHLFHLDQFNIKRRRIQLELYLRKICNDYILMDIPQVKDVLLVFLGFNHKPIVGPVYQNYFYRDVKVLKGNISKALINNDYVTFYQFKLYRQGIQIRSVNKRFSDFLDLHRQISRWMHNIQICYKNINLPQKHLYKSESHRHQKLRNYLQHIIEVKDSYKVYSLNVFFNICGNCQLSDDTFFSAISVVQSQSKQDFKSFYLKSHQRNSQMERQMVENYHKYQGTEQAYSFSTDGRRMSALIDQLGHHFND